MDRYHPIVAVTYFIAIFALSCCFMHPFTLAIGLIGVFAYSFLLNGAGVFKSNFLYIFPVLMLAALVNPVFNHSGVTILAYFPSGKALTLESVVYGIASAFMLWTMLCCFSCFNKVMTTDKLVYLMGRLFPGISLVLSMIFSFVPRFKLQLAAIINSQRNIGRDIGSGSMVNRIKNGIKILSVMISWSLENSIDTADSMKSRGYGLGKRTSYSNFAMTKRDVLALFYIALLSLHIVWGAVFKDAFYSSFYPYAEFGKITGATAGYFVSYVLLFMYPSIIRLWEVITWKRLKSKI